MDQSSSMMDRFDNEIVAQIMRRRGGRATSQNIYDDVIATARDTLAKGQLSRRLVAMIRLAVKLNPYVPEVPALIELHHQALKGLAEQKMPALMHIVRNAAARNLPVPIIVSCEKYIDKAIALQKQLVDRLWGVPSIILRGDPALSEEKIDGSILTIPIPDSYEALPLKVFEMDLFFSALDPKCGIVKIDDDLVPIAGHVSDAGQAAALFGVADYIGIGINNIFLDRVWHFGKCATPVPAIYGKPIQAPWARGALYYLSCNALAALSKHYMRFPGCLAGELYEDKAVGDALHRNGMMLMSYPLEKMMGLDSRMQERT